MVCEKVENDEFVIQNNLHSHMPERIQINRKQRFFMRNGDKTKINKLRQMARHKKYVNFEKMSDFAHKTKFVADKDVILKVPLTSDFHGTKCKIEDCDCMQVEEWYLLDRAYSITLTPHHEDDMDAVARTSSIPVIFGNPDGTFTSPFDF